jgi:hypothetical protein
MPGEEITVVSVTHDLQKKRSLVLIKWDNNGDRRLSLPIPFETQLHDLLSATQVAILELQNELAGAHLKLAQAPDTDVGD